MSLYGLDLNLLVVFDALMTERSVTRAGTRLGLSQPAVSNALGRLRDALGDAIMVRAGSRMEPTPRALELAAPVKRSLDELSQALFATAEFDPRASEHVFRLAAADDMELTLMPRLLEHIKAIAPGIDIEVSRQLGTVEQSLRNGRIDLYLGVWFNIPAAFHNQLLRKETFACIARKNHPALGDGLSLDVFTELGHVVVAPSERPGSVVDTVLSDRGLGRRVVLRTPHFLVAPLVVARTDLIATLPRTVATSCESFLDLDVYDPPVDAPGFPVHMVWHQRTHQLASHRWLREQVTQVVTADSDW